MTGDLVERLRDEFRYGYPGWHQPCNEAMAEAADRIEELELEVHLRQGRINALEAERCIVGHDWHRSVHAPPDECLRCGRKEDRG